jgi:DNA-binding GntR family transcriptional regulator
MVKRSALQPTAIVEDANGEPIRSLIERTYALMREDIISGSLAPGKKLRVEHLRTRYRVSAGTLREATTRLVSDAFVIAESQRGFRVKPITLADLEDLTRLRLHIEIDALRSSIRQEDDTWRANLRRAFDEISLVEQPLQPEFRAHWEILNSRFHEALIAGCASPWTLNVLRMLAMHSERYRRYTIALPDSGRDVHAEHGEIFRHAMAGNDVRAALALEAHIRNTLDLVINARRRGIDVLRSEDISSTSPSGEPL